MHKNHWMRSFLATAALLTWVTLGTSCATATKTVKYNYGENLDPRPSLVPETVDNSPQPCASCPNVNGQPTFIITGRDFVAIKRKILEMDDYINYLEAVLRAYGAID